MIISHPSTNSEEQLRLLWKRVFNDTDQYIDLFFSRRYKNSQALTVSDGDRIVSMLHALPIELVVDGKSFSARYIYAVATLPEYQKMGLSSSLMEAMHDWLRKEKIYASILVPASSELFYFYEKRGYRTAFSVSEKTMYFNEAASFEPVGLKDAPLYSLKNLRDRYFGRSELFARWDLDALAYQDEETALVGGSVLYYEEPFEGYAVCVPIDDGYYVKEYIGGAGDELILKSIAARLQSPKLIVRGISNGKSRDFGMIYWYRPIEKFSLSGCRLPPYLGLVLD
jgi:GNAT superfamily N-acetyltransferase